MDKSNGTAPPAAGSSTMTQSGGPSFASCTEEPRPHGNALPAHKVERIIQLDVEGLARVAIRERLDVSLNTITKYLRLAGRPLSRFGRKPGRHRANAAP